MGVTACDRGVGDVDLHRVPFPISAGAPDAQAVLMDDHAFAKQLPADSACPLPDPVDFGFPLLPEFFWIGYLCDTIENRN